MDPQKGVQPWGMNLVGEFTANVNMMEDPCQDPTGFQPRSIVGVFELPFDNRFLYPVATELLLNNCDLGRKPDPPTP